MPTGRLTKKWRLLARLQGRQQRKPVATSAAEELSEAEQHRLLHEVFGSWKLEESSEEMARRLYDDRQDQPREVNL